MPVPWILYEKNLLRDFQVPAALLGSFWDRYDSWDCTAHVDTSSAERHPKQKKLESTLLKYTDFLRQICETKMPKPEFLGRKNSSKWQSIRCIYIYLDVIGPQTLIVARTDSDCGLRPLGKNLKLWIQIDLVEGQGLCWEESLTSHQEFLLTAIKLAYWTHRPIPALPKYRDTSLWHSPCLKYRSSSFGRGKNWGRRWKRRLTAVQLIFVLVLVRTLL